MDYKEPKTRKELKGSGKQKQGPYSSKRVRQLEALQEAMQKKGKAPQPQPKK